MTGHFHGNLNGALFVALAQDGQGGVSQMLAQTADSRADDIHAAQAGADHQLQHGPVPQTQQRIGRIRLPEGLSPAACSGPASCCPG